MEFKALHLFCGIGGGALGFQQAREEWKGTVGRIETLAGIDVDPEVCQDFENITGAPAIRMDLFSREQYKDFHGKEPSPGWEEVTPYDIWRAVDGEYPDILFTSPPCKGFSGLLPQKAAASRKYQALNGLTLRGIALCLKAFEEDPPSLILLENVPLITKRGKGLLQEIVRLLKRNGYAVAEGYHDCGEIGGLGQVRRRYLLIARHERKVPAFVYHPPKKRVRSIGEVLAPLPLPGDPAGGPMHRLPRLQWKTWVRLALIPPGGDWRDLNKHPLHQYRIQHQPRRGACRVERWDQPSVTVTGAPSWGRSNGAGAVADPRLPENVSDWVRLGCRPRSGTYGVQAWDQPGKTVTGSADIHNCAAAVADPRIPKDTELGVWVIISEDGTWHRPLTTYELAMLQGFPSHLPDGRPFQLVGKNDARWRERIGNAVPPPAARAIAETMLRTLMPAREGLWVMDAEPIWVHPIEKSLDTFFCR